LQRGDDFVDFGLRGVRAADEDYFVESVFHGSSVSLRLIG
jgi:hypothetical protein